MSKAGIITYNIIIHRVTINQIRTIVGDTVSLSPSVKSSIITRILRPHKPDKLLLLFCFLRRVPYYHTTAITAVCDVNDSSIKEKTPRLWYDINCPILIIIINNIITVFIER